MVVVGGGRDFTSQQAAEIRPRQVLRVGRVVAPAADEGRGRILVGRTEVGQGRIRLGRGPIRGCDDPTPVGRRKAVG
jgi:hypothetical protein